MSMQNTRHAAATLTRNFWATCATLRRLSVLGLSVLLLSQALSAPLLAQGLKGNSKTKAKDETVLVNPLAKDDPRAQLDPQLLGAQAMPPRTGQPDAAEQPMVIERDLTTGQETRSPGQALAVTSELTTFGQTGAAGPRAQTEDPEQARAQARPTTEQAQAIDSLCIDNEQAKHNTWEYPWSTQVKLFMTFPNGGTYVGSGTMIGSKYVITHQNNIYYPAFGGLATRVEVIPGLDGTYKPFGSAFAVYLRYFYHGASNVGLITLDRHIGFSTGWLGYGNFTDSFIESFYGHLAGYPVSKDLGWVLFYDFGLVDVLSFDQARVSRLFLAGELGAGTYLKESNGFRYVWGVSAGSYYCSTTVDRLTSWMVGQFNFVIANGL